MYFDDGTLLAVRFDLRAKQAGLDDPATMLTSIIVVQNWFEELKRLVP